MADTLPRWDVSDVYDSLGGRRFGDAVERLEAEISRLVAAFDEHDIRRVPPRPPTADDGRAADAVIGALNEVLDLHQELSATVRATVATDSYDDRAQTLNSQLVALGARLRPCQARLADWVASLDPDELGVHSVVAAEHVGTLRRLAERSIHQMVEGEEGLYAELATSGSAAWARLHADLTSQLTADVLEPGGAVTRLAMAAVRGLATDGDPARRRAAYEAELQAWPTVGLACAAALNGVKGEANTVNARRGWQTPLDAALFANSVGRPTFDALRAAVDGALGDFRRWLRRKATLHGYDGGLRWWDLVAPLPGAGGPISWDEGLDLVRGAFAGYGGPLSGLVDRAAAERWIDAEPREGKRGGAFCLPFVGDRSLVFLNWSGSVDSAQTTAHELGHAYHNTQLAARTALQRQLPMALAETASIFCETLVVEAGLDTLSGRQRLALLDMDLAGATQVVVDIRSRFLFESELFARRRRRTLGVAELNELMTASQAAAYGDGLDLSTAHPWMWAVKPHYYGSHFYNWPYTYGLLFGLGLFSRYREDRERFRAGYDDVLSHAGMDSAETLGAAFGIDVTDEAFWNASLDVLRSRMADYEALSSQLSGPSFDGHAVDGLSDPGDPARRG